MGSLQSSQNTQLTLIPCDDSQGSAQRAFRSRSDSLDIFTMSPLGTPPFDSQLGPSTPQLRLPEPPDLDLDLGLSKSSNQAANNFVPYHSTSPPSTPNSPTSFSFSPPHHTGSQHHFGAKAYPFDPQSHSVVGGTSYGTDMTSVIGSWDDKESHNEGPSVLDNKGKDVQQEPCDDSLDVVLESSSNKGKGKAVDECSILSSPSHASFGFDFEFHHAQDLDLELKSMQSHEDAGVTECDASGDSPVVRLSPGSQYRQSREEDAGVYAGPSTRNGDVAALSLEDVSSSPDLGLSQEAQASSASSSRPTSPPPLSGPSSFRISNEGSSRSLPGHRRSLSSISLRSIRSSSSRSMASIRSTLGGAGFRGKVR